MRTLLWLLLFLSFSFALVTSSFPYANAPTNSPYPTTTIGYSIRKIGSDSYELGVSVFYKDTRLESDYSKYLKDAKIYVLYNQQGNYVPLSSCPQITTDISSVIISGNTVSKAYFGTCKITIPSNVHDCINVKLVYKGDKEDDINYPPTETELYLCKQQELNLFASVHDQVERQKLPCLPVLLIIGLAMSVFYLRYNTFTTTLFDVTHVHIPKPPKSKYKWTTRGMHGVSKIVLGIAAKKLDKQIKKLEKSGKKPSKTMKWVKESLDQTLKQEKKFSISYGFVKLIKNTFKIGKKDETTTKKPTNKATPGNVRTSLADKSINILDKTSNVASKIGRYVGESIFAPFTFAMRRLKEGFLGSIVYGTKGLLFLPMFFIYQGVHSKTIDKMAAKTGVSGKIGKKTKNLRGKLKSKFKMFSSLDSFIGYFIHIDTDTKVNSLNKQAVRAVVNKMFLDILRKTNSHKFVEEFSKKMLNLEINKTDIEKLLKEIGNLENNKELNDYLSEVAKLIHDFENGGITTKQFFSKLNRISNKAKYSSLISNELKDVLRDIATNWKDIDLKKNPNTKLSDYIINQTLLLTHLGELEIDKSQKDLTVLEQEAQLISSSFYDLSMNDYFSNNNSNILGDSISLSLSMQAHTVAGYWVVEPSNDFAVILKDLSYLQKQLMMRFIQLPTDSYSYVNVEEVKKHIDPILLLQGKEGIIKLKNKISETIKKTNDQNLKNDLNHVLNYLDSNSILNTPFAFFKDAKQINVGSNTAYESLFYNTFGTPFNLNKRDYKELGFSWYVIDDPNMLKKPREDAFKSIKGPVYADRFALPFTLIAKKSRKVDSDFLVEFKHFMGMQLTGLISHFSYHNLEESQNKSKKELSELLNLRQYAAHVKGKKIDDITFKDLIELMGSEEERREVRLSDLKDIPDAVWVSGNRGLRPVFTNPQLTEREFKILNKNKARIELNTLIIHLDELEKNKQLNLWGKKLLKKLRMHKTPDTLNSFKNKIITTDGKALLHLLSLEGNYTVAKYLLENGANVNCLDHDGLTPLHYAASRNDFGMVSLLLDYNALNIKDKNDRLPVDYAFDERIKNYLLVNAKIKPTRKNFELAIEELHSNPNLTDVQKDRLKQIINKYVEDEISKIPNLKNKIKSNNDIYNFLYRRNNKLTLAKQALDNKAYRLAELMLDLYDLTTKRVDVKKMEKIGLFKNIDKLPPRLRKRLNNYKHSLSQNQEIIDYYDLGISQQVVIDETPLNIEDFYIDRNGERVRALDVERVSFEDILGISKLKKDGGDVNKEVKKVSKYIKKGNKKEVKKIFNVPEAELVDIFTKQHLDELNNSFNILNKRTEYLKHKFEELSLNKSPNVEAQFKKELLTVEYYKLQEMIDKINKMKNIPKPDKNKAINELKNIQKLIEQEMRGPPDKKLYDKLKTDETYLNIFNIDFVLFVSDKIKGDLAKPNKQNALLNLALELHKSDIKSIRSLVMSKDILHTLNPKGNLINTLSNFRKYYSFLNDFKLQYTMFEEIQKNGEISFSKFLFLYSQLGASYSKLRLFFGNRSILQLFNKNISKMNQDNMLNIFVSEFRANYLTKGNAVVSRDQLIFLLEFFSIGPKISSLKRDKINNLIDSIAGKHVVSDEFLVRFCRYIYNETNDFSFLLRLANIKDSSYFFGSRFNVDKKYKNYLKKHKLFERHIKESSSRLAKHLVSSFPMFLVGEDVLKAGYKLQITYANLFYNTYELEEELREKREKKLLKYIYRLRVLNEWHMTREPGHITYNLPDRWSRYAKLAGTFNAQVSQMHPNWAEDIIYGGLFNYSGLSYWEWFLFRRFITGSVLITNLFRRPFVLAFRAFNKALMYPSHLEQTYLKRPDLYSEEELENNRVGFRNSIKNPKHVLNVKATVPVYKDKKVVGYTEKRMYPDVLGGFTRATKLMLTSLTGLPGILLATTFISPILTGTLLTSFLIAPRFTWNRFEEIYKYTHVHSGSLFEDFETEGDKSINSLLRIYRRYILQPLFLGPKLLFETFGITEDYGVADYYERFRSVRPAIAFNYLSPTIGTFHAIPGFMYFENNTSRVILEPWVISELNSFGYQHTFSNNYISLYRNPLSTLLDRHYESEKEFSGYGPRYNYPYAFLLPHFLFPFLDYFSKSYLLPKISSATYYMRNIKENKKYLASKALKLGLFGGIMYANPIIAAGILTFTVANKMGEEAGGHMGICPRCGNKKVKGSKCPVCGFVPKNKYF